MYGGEVEDARGGGGRAPVADAVEQVVTGRGDRGGPRCARRRGLPRAHRVPAPAVPLCPFRGSPDRFGLRSPGHLALRLLGLFGEEREEFVGQAQIEGVLGVRTGTRVAAGGGVGGGTGVGARIGGRHGDAPLRRRGGSCSSGMKGVGDGDVDGLGVDRTDEFVEAVQPGQQVGLAAQNG